jgi:DNA (cytosine-5)-methyltransferase 1
MSCGFARHPGFKIVGAVDVQVGKPSTGHGALQCNSTYFDNIGVTPLELDLARVAPDQLRQALGLSHQKLDVLVACPPCTGFTRTIAENHLRDDARNTLVARTALYVAAFEPQVFVMENARELLTGKFRGHFEALSKALTELGYQMSYDVHMLTDFGLPQQRERAIVMATRGCRPRSISDLWKGYTIEPKATHVRRAIYDLPWIESGATSASDPAHTSTLLAGHSLRRIRSIPHDGGSWKELIGNRSSERYLTPNMWRTIERGRLNQFCDVYGRMSWDRPAPTIKRESAHPGNGRYSHPEQDRLCTVREMAVLQGFPNDYRFTSRSRKNAYRNVGDAVPPLVSFQLAWAVHWALAGGRRPTPEQFVLPNTNLSPSDIHLVGSI